MGLGYRLNKEIMDFRTNLKRQPRRTRWPGRRPTRLGAAGSCRWAAARAGVGAGLGRGSGEGFEAGAWGVGRLGQWSGRGAGLDGARPVGRPKTARASQQRLRPRLRRVCAKTPPRRRCCAPRSPLAWGFPRSVGGWGLGWGRASPRLAGCVVVPQLVATGQPLALQCPAPQPPD